MIRERKEVYSPPRIKTVSFVVEMGLGMSSTRFELDTWDDDTPGSHTTGFDSDYLGGDGNTTTSFELERW
jgi:hypothetical protein